MNKMKLDIKKEDIPSIVLNYFKRNIPLIGLIVIVIMLMILSPSFLTKYNIISVLRQGSINGLLAFGVTIVIISGGIDLSVGSTLAFTGMIFAKAIVDGIPAPIAFVIALIAGAIIGAINGVLISRGKLQPFIATLGSMMVFRGLTLYISNGVPVSRLGDTGFAAWIGRGYFLGIPIPAIMLIIITIAFAFFLSKTVFGKRIYAIGGNAKGAKLSGINVKRNIVYIYMISGLLAAFAAVILVSRLDSAVPTAGISYELNAIAAAVIGGTSLTGGKGKASGTLIGILIIAVIINGLNLLGTSAYLQQIITGLIIIFAVIADRKK